MTPITPHFTFIRRKDAQMWAITTAGDLRRLLNHLEIPDDWEIMPNTAGNLMVFRPEGETRWYVGYVDVTLGTIVLEPDARQNVRFDCATAFGDPLAKLIRP